MPKINEKDESAVKDIRAFFGTSGSGKTYQIKKIIKPAKRALVFDPDGLYEQEGFEAFTSPWAFAKAVHANTGRPMRYALEADGPEAFDIFCRTAWWERTAAAPLCVAVDELAGVANTGKARGAWHALLTRGRKYRVSILAGAQSPTEIDKTLMRQRSHLWVGYMARPQDWEYMARETGIDVSVFSGLRGRPYFDSVAWVNGKEPVISKNKRKKPVGTGI